MYDTGTFLLLLYYIFSSLYNNRKCMIILHWTLKEGDKNILTYNDVDGTIVLKGGDWMGDELGKRVLEYRARHNLTQEEFAMIAKLNLMTVNAIENGKREPSKLTRAKIEQIIKEDE